MHTTADLSGLAYVHISYETPSSTEFKIYVQLSAIWWWR